MILPYLIASISFFSGLFLAIWYFPEMLDYIIEKSQKRGFYNGPWKTHLGVGRMHIPKIEKAAIARVGLGANSSEETIYWNAFTDSDGNELNSAYHYQVIFEQNLPIAYDNHGFWSITVYGEDKYLVENPQKKYMIRYAANIEETIQFPLIIELSRLSAKPNPMTIPLPTRVEKFSVALRCYRPLDSMKNQSSCSTLSLPLIKRLP